MIRTNKKFWAHILNLALLVALVLVAYPATGVSANQNSDAATFRAVVNWNGSNGWGQAPFQVTPPGQARVGDTITMDVSGGAPGASGFLMTLQFDEAGLDFVNAEFSPALKGAGVDVLEVGPVRSDGSVTYGAVTCPVADCTSTNYSQGRGPQVGNPALLNARGGMPLARLHFIVRAPDQYALTIGKADLAGPRGERQLQAAPSAAPAFDPARLARLDLTHNGIINDSDAWTAIGAWEDLAARDQCISPATASYDVDGSGCIDLADFQMILGHWGESIVPAAAAETGTAAPAAAEAVTAALTLTVNDTGDGSDANPGDGVCATSGGKCTLRAAIEESNAAVGADTINFNIRNSDGSCPSLVAIQPASNLHVDDKLGYGVLMDGYSQCNARANSNAVTGNAAIKVEIKGSQVPDIFGLYLNSQNNTVRGLALYNFNNQLMIRGTRAHDNKIEGSFIGTNAANTFTANFAGENNGLYIANYATNNTIGGTSPDKRNLVSGNDQDGVNLQGNGVNYNVFIGNYIGLKQDGVTALRNSSDGVDIAEGASYNRFGGLNAGERNVIAGNGGDGVELSHGGSHDNEVVGNFIGMNNTGSATTRNNKIGVTFEDTVTNNKVYRNIIVGNGGFGVRVFTSNSNQVYDNFIGAYPPGLGSSSVVPEPSAGLLGSLVNAPNGTLNNGAGKDGLRVLGGSQRNLIQGNVISNHAQYGVLVSVERGYLAIGTCMSYYNTISENFIYNNGQKGIRLNSGDCGGTVYYANERIAQPRISSATTSLATGTACANCRVEIFLADKSTISDPSGENSGEGKLLVGSGTASASGSYSIAISGVSSGQILTATSTNGAGDTSEFARNVAVR